MASFPASCISTNSVPKKIEGSTKKPIIPIIDLQGGSNITSQIVNACQTVGAFLVINHGIPMEKMNKAMKNIEDFHSLPLEEKKKYPLKGDTNNVCTIVFHNEEEMLKHGHRRDALQLECTRFDESVKFWPDNPKHFKEDIGEHLLALKDISSRILEHLSEGLGLELGYLGGELSAQSWLILNHYPSSRDPESTPGFQKHIDWSVITLIQSGHVPGLQLFKNGQWLDVETPPEAFVVLMGSQTEVISNGKLKGALHRVTRPSEARYSANYSRCPPPDCLVEPAKEILKAQNTPPLYKSFRFKDDIAEKLIGLDKDNDGFSDFIRELITIS